MGNPFGTDVDPDAAPDPMSLVRAWVGEPDRPLVMTLTTVAEDGAPDARYVHLYEVADEEVRFHTDARSRKTAQLRADPRVTLAIFWPEPLRQLVVAGVAAPVPAATLDADFGRISRYLQVLSWVNDDALAARPAGERREVLAAFEAAHPGAPRAAGVVDRLRGSPPSADLLARRRRRPEQSPRVPSGARMPRGGRPASPDSRRDGITGRACHSFRVVPAGNGGRLLWAGLG